MAIKKIADHPRLNLVGQFVCSSSTKHMVQPRRVDAVDGDILSYTSLEFGQFRPKQSGREVLPVVSQHTGRFRRHRVDIACDTAEEVLAVWNQVRANRFAVAEFERSLQRDVPRAVVGELSATGATAGAVPGVAK